MALAAIEPDEFVAIPGRGIAARVHKAEILVGSRAFLEERGIATDSVRALDGATAVSEVLVARSARLLGAIRVADGLRPEAKGAVEALRKMGIRTLLLTGDQRKSATAVARDLGVDEVLSELLPEEKVEVVERLVAEGRRVVMLGDGINDAPALAEAHVGIAMGTGTDVAMESAGITLVTGDLRALVRARRLSRATMKNIRQNLFLAFAYNAIGVPVAAGILYPFTGLLVSPIWASAAMTFSSVSVIANALRLRAVDLHVG
jgi:Cu+-exporting ATPase